MLFNSFDFGEYMFQYLRLPRFFLFFVLYQSVWTQNQPVLTIEILNHEHKKIGYDLKYLFDGSIAENAFATIKSKLVSNTDFVLRASFFKNYDKWMEMKKDADIKTFLINTIDGFVKRFQGRFDKYNHKMRCINVACIELIKCCYKDDQEVQKFSDTLIEKFCSYGTDKMKRTECFNDIFASIKNLSKRNDDISRNIIEILDQYLLQPMSIKIFFSAAVGNGHEITEIVDLYILFENFYFKITNESAIEHFEFFCEKYIEYLNEKESKKFFYVINLKTVKKMDESGKFQDFDQEEEKKLVEALKSKFDILTKAGDPQLLDIAELLEIMNHRGEKYTKKDIEFAGEVVKIVENLEKSASTISIEKPVSEIMQTVCKKLLDGTGCTIVFKNKAINEKFLTYSFVGIFTCIGICIFFKDHFKKFHNALCQSISMSNIKKFLLKIML